jgi:hypothetical protein
LFSSLSQAGAEVDCNLSTTTAASSSSAPAATSVRAPAAPIDAPTPSLAAAGHTLLQDKYLKRKNNDLDHLKKGKLCGAKLQLFVR